MKNQIRESIKTVYCIYAGKNNLLKIKEPFSVYRIDEHEEDDFNMYYTILDNTLSYISWPKDYFLDEDEYNNLKEEGLLDVFIQNKKEELDRKNKIREAFYSDEDIISEILSFIEERKQSFLDYEENLLFSFLGKDIVVRKRKEKNIKNIYNYINKLNNLNNLPLDFLGKIQLINNQLNILTYMGISKTLLGTIQEISELILTLCENQLTEDNLMNINNLLEETLGYIESLKNAKEEEEEYITKKMADNINKIINDNAILFKKMKEDNDNIFSKMYY